VRLRTPLSHAWWWRGIWGATRFRQVESPSRAAAAKALELDPQLAEAHVSAGRIKFGHEWNWTGADKDFKRALELDPNNADAHFFSAMLCMALGCLSKSVAYMKRVEQLDPLSSIELDPQNPAGACSRLANVYEELGRYDEALALSDKEKSAGTPRDRGASLSTARVYARMGKRREPREILDAWRGGSPHVLATVYAALGDRDEAFRQLY
jgi:tetratricopeptide (TPR) repeat protein